MDPSLPLPPFLIEQEIQASLERTPEMGLCAALLAWQRRHNQEESVALLDEVR